MHWACERCLVRACCQEDCYMTKLFDPLCIECEKNMTCEERCKSVLFSEAMDRLEKSHGYIFREYMIRHMKETSVLYKFCNMGRETYGENLGLS